MWFHHYGIEVTNLEESVAFYKKHLGLEEERRIFFMGEEIVFLAAGDFRLELISSPCEGTHLCFEVNDLNVAINQFDANRKIEGPYKLDNGWKTIFFEGPNNEVIEFLQVRSGS
ncbi:VOC family protein [Neobacillus drentensis]|uniref:VOC family protein n=1 Tax=Neobacillus drentensis TaxID=220684 RepID=UPI003002AE97